jgi:HEPN domain-containing protein
MFHAIIATMTPQEMVDYWLITADHSWKTAQDLFEKRDYVDALFYGHLYLEKLLKAAAVQRTQNDAPWGHKLNKIAEAANLALTSEQLDLLKRVTEYNIKTRYPDWKFEFRKKCNKKFCQTELNEIQRFGKWLRKQIKP